MSQNARDLSQDADSNLKKQEAKYSLRIIHVQYHVPAQCIPVLVFICFAG